MIRVVLIFSICLACASACLVEIKPLAEASGGGGSAGTAGAGGTPSGSGGGGASSGACPNEMAHITHDLFPDVSFCIDKLEVTQQQYVAFLSQVGDVSNAEQPSPACDFNADLTRTNAGSACPTFTSGDNRAVNCVDWCDAYAYCAAKGKRLCGELNTGGPLDIDAPVTVDEWHFACTHGFEREYPYGDAGIICHCYIPEEWQTENMCDTTGITNLNHKAEVGAHPNCEGGYPGIFDMQGNASEWTNRCESGADGTGNEACSRRGGTTFSVGGSSYYRCSNLDQAEARNDAATDVGIRCCRDAD